MSALLNANCVLTHENLSESAHCLFHSLSFSPVTTATHLFVSVCVWGEWWIWRSVLNAECVSIVLVLIMHAHFSSNTYIRDTHTQTLLWLTIAEIEEDSCVSIYLYFCSVTTDTCTQSAALHWLALPPPRLLSTVSKSLRNPNCAFIFLSVLWTPQTDRLRCEVSGSSP